QEPRLLPLDLLPRPRRRRSRAGHRLTRLHRRRAGRRARPRLQAPRLARARPPGHQSEPAGHRQPRVRRPLQVKRAIALAVLFGAAGLAISLWLLGENLASVTRLPLWALGLGAVLVGVNYLAGAVRLHLLTAMVDHPITLVGAVRAYALGLFSAALTPGNAGQAPAVVLSFTGDGMPASRAWSVNLYVWVLDLVLLTYS